MKCYVDSSVILSYLLTESTDFERTKEFDTTASRAAELWANLDQEPLVVFTFDTQLRTCARAMGIHTI